MINSGNASNNFANLLDYIVPHIYKLYINIKDIENATITFNAITRYLFNGIYSESITG